MTFADEVKKVGRQPINQVELTLDKCDNSYGLSPCTATLALTNLLQRSEEFNLSNWHKNQLSVTAQDIANPINGLVTADKLLETIVNNQHFVDQHATTIDPTKIGTWSIYILGIGRSNFRLTIFNDTDTNHRFRAEFDLANRTVSDSAILGNGVFLKARMQPIGLAGWYRLSITGIPETTGVSTEGVRARVNVLDALGGATSYVGDVTKGFYAFGGQYRLGSNSGKYQQTPLSAAIDGGGIINDLCHNTFATCQDTPNYVKVTKVIKFIDAVAQPYGIEGFPVIKNISYAATKINPGRGLGVRAKVTITLRDFPHNDVGQDDYAIERTFNPEIQGTFFGKLKKRNQYYQGRKIVLKEGYLDDTGAIAFTQNREYIIDEITGPDGNGIVKIVAKDILKLASNEKGQAPTPALKAWKQSGALGTTGNPTADSIAIAQAIWDEADGTGSTGSTNRHIRVDDEIMLLGVRPTTTTIIVTRAQGGTNAATHNDDATIQPCLSYGVESIALIIQELLENFSAVPTAFITIADWNTEKTDHLTNFDLTTIIAEPTGVSNLIVELSQLALVDLWWDDLNQQIRFKVQSPYQVTPLPVLTDELNILKDSLKVKDVVARRLSRVLIWYGIRNYAKDIKEPQNYARASFEIEADKEGVNKYNQVQTTQFFNRWHLVTDNAEVELTSNRLVTRYGNTPIEVTFKIDAQDIEIINTGDVFDLITRQIQKADGSNDTTRLQVIEMRPLRGGTDYMVKAFAYFTDPVSEGPLTISTNRTDLDLFVELNGPSGPIIKEIIIDTGVTIDATVGNFAITMGDLPSGSDIHVRVKGSVYAHGGPGGDGGTGKWRSVWDPEPPASCLIFGSETDGEQGSPGGDAIGANPSNNITLRVTVESGGELFAGGGGGAGGKADVDFVDNGDVIGGPGGGGGVGSDTAPGGTGKTGIIVLDGCGNPVVRTANNGGDGGLVTAGIGGASTFGNEAGANGGDWATDGGDSPTEGTQGGPAGFAIRYNGSTPDEDFQATSDVRGVTG